MPLHVADDWGRPQKSAATRGASFGPWPPSLLLLLLPLPPPAGPNPKRPAPPDVHPEPCTAPASGGVPWAACLAPAAPATRHIIIQRQQPLHNFERWAHGQQPVRARTRLFERSPRRINQAQDGGCVRAHGPRGTQLNAASYSRRRAPLTEAGRRRPPPQQQPGWNEGPRHDDEESFVGGPNGSMKVEASRTPPPQFRVPSQARVHRFKARDRGWGHHPHAHSSRWDHRSRLHLIGSRPPCWSLRALLRSMLISLCSKLPCGQLSRNSDFYFLVPIVCTASPVPVFP